MKTRPRRVLSSELLADRWLWNCGLPLWRKAHEPERSQVNTPPVRARTPLHQKAETKIQSRTDGQQIDWYSREIPMREMTLRELQTFKRFQKWNHTHQLNSPTSNIYTRIGKWSNDNRRANRTKFESGQQTERTEIFSSLLTLAPQKSRGRRVVNERKRPAFINAPMIRLLLGKPGFPNFVKFVSLFPLKIILRIELVSIV